MNRKGILILILLLFLNSLFVSITVFSLSSQAPRPVSLDALETAVAITHLQGQAPQASGGGEWQFPDDEISTLQRQSIEAVLAQNRARLQAEGVLPSLTANTTVSYGWPLQPAGHLDDYGYHGLANFVDHNPAYPYQRLDFTCSDRTYDTHNGYNHPGTDIFTWPFPWLRMDNDEVAVVAAAPGIIIHRQDGNFDRNCSFTHLPWNAVYIQHADGSIAWYGHLKNGSVTAKGVGDAVAAGEYLGIVGSSGSSTAPHLHLELHTPGNSTLDPFAGACNATTGDSLWAEQPPYYDTAVNKITTGYAPPVTSACSTPEQPNAAVEFVPGETIYFTTYYRDQLGSLPSQYTILEPDGTVYAQWMHSIPGDHYAASWWWWSFDLEPDVPQGYWQYDVAVNGQVYTHTFLVGTPPPPPPAPPPDAITVTTPNGGEVISPGLALSITWQTILTAPLQIDLIGDGLMTQTLTTTGAISGNGRFLWTPPLTATTHLYRIRVSDVLSPTRFDESDGPFIIGVLKNHTYFPVGRQATP